MFKTFPHEVIRAPGLLYLDASRPQYLAFIFWSEMLVLIAANLSPLQLQMEEMQRHGYLC